MLAVLANQKGEVVMLGSKSVFASLYSCAATISLLLALSVVAGAQTPSAVSDKLRVDSSSPESATGEGDAKSKQTGSDPLPSTPNTSETGPLVPKPEHAVTTTAPSLAPCPGTDRTITADVIALPQPIMLNRLGASIPDGLVFALRQDTVANGNQFQLRDGKRPRPLVLRANVGDCLKITLTNAIPPNNFSTTKVPGAATGTTEVSIHVQGMEWVESPQDDGSFVGKNNSSLASAAAASPSPMPSPVQTYTLHAKEEGTFLLYTMGDTSTQGLQLERGLFGAVNVQPKGAEWYRSQVTADDLTLATYNAKSLPPNTTITPGDCTNTNPCTLTINGPTVRRIKVLKTADSYLSTLDNHPLINYDAAYPSIRADGSPVPAQLVGLPILKMLDVDQRIVHSDLTAIITGPGAGRFPGTTGPTKPEPPCKAGNPVGSNVDPLFCENPASPDRKQPYREVTIFYHEVLSPVASQAFPIFTNPDGTPNGTVAAGKDAFAINYGTGGIAAEVYANRIGVGPMGDCVDCKFEEFFLSAWSVGDPAMLVDAPANSSLTPPPTSPAAPPLPWIQQRTGKVTFSNGSATVTGVGTAFKSELSKGDLLVLQTSPGTVSGTVNTIASNTQLTLKSPATGSGSGAYGSSSASQPPFPSNPANPLPPAAAWLCSGPQLGDKPPTAPDPTCANAKTPVAGAVNGEPYTLTPLAKATRAYYPDDPSNVYHSYINDHLKFRILHGGTGVSHVHHQHAHQWLQSPNSDQGSYLDSQMISPGASYTLEMVYNGSGNRNKVVGDSIFHCHFYPHFAAGMWAMWRTHDVFESGTYVYPQGATVNGKDVSGQVVPGSRALPDGEIVTGVATPAVVPMPTLPMAPLPAYAQIQTGVQVQGAQTHFGGQVVIGGTCSGNKINGLDVNGGCTDGQNLNGTVINSHFNGTQMTGQFQPSAGNALENPGFPYFIPGIAGARAPHPPLDFAPDTVNGGVLDGGLPRHLVAGGSISYERHNTYDWSKDLATMDAVKLPEDGTPVEKAAMSFFSKRCYPTFFPDGTPGSCPSSASTPPQSTLNTPPTGFVLNGLPLGPQAGAPFADPAVDDNGNAVGNKRTYKAAAIQLNVVLNKKALGWHFPQQRMLTLWDDVSRSIDFSFGKPGRPPEPLFFRGNSGDVIEYWHTNLVPNYYVVDDFQVRTPTDILGQHIHLVKFDVTSSDGAGNGFNYEDGTFSPQEVQETIKAINASANNGFINAPNQPLKPTAPPKEIFDCALNPGDPRCKLCTEVWTPTSRPICKSWWGAQTTIQRWYLDPLVDDQGVDRTLRTVFTHDHFGPSTHQQAGLYAGLLVEPLKSTWRDPETGLNMGSRSDGGPTSWKADILTTNKDLSYREFALEFQDFQLAYQVNQLPGKAPAKYPNASSEPDSNPNNGYRNNSYAIGAPGPTPTLISTAGTLGTQSVNYLNEPIPYRVGSGDLSSAFDSSIVQPGSMMGMSGDPITPMLRAYQGDKVQLRLLVGAHMFAHQFNLEGPTWFAEPSWKNSGYRSAQPMGLSEHFELLFNVPSSSAPNTARQCPDNHSQANCVDYFYSPSLDEFGISNGLWGLFRAYDPTKPASKLPALPNNPIGPTTKTAYATCPSPLPAPAINRVFNITAVTAQVALSKRSPLNGSPGKGTIVFNERGGPTKELNASRGIMYVRSEDLDSNGLLKAGAPIEPLILRANAGDCITVNLTNGISPYSDVFNQAILYAPPLSNMVPGIKPSRLVGLHPQLLSYDAATSTGANIGYNSKNLPSQIATYKGVTKTYQWYAGKIERDSSGNLNYTPVEFGTLNLFPSDPLLHASNSLFGSMVIEPAGSSWTCDAKDSNGNPLPSVSCDPPSSTNNFTRASATVKDSTSQQEFREFVLMISDDIRISGGNSSAVNYRTEPKTFRYAGNSTKDFSCMLSNQLIQGATKDPKTPIFTAPVGAGVRFRMAHPYGTGTSQVFAVHGHVWQRNPYQQNSQAIGNNNLSQWLGSRDNHGATDHFEAVINKAGGVNGTAGDYLYTVFLPGQAKLGPWGIFRVGNATQTQDTNAACAAPAAVPAAARRAPAQPENVEDRDRFIRQPINKERPRQPTRPR
jgi:hypothetical protein